ncbi:hypothetical protein HY643_02440 [Candidatus Woesearchaeota archaeon]|nr:hypothetical protein [Candidatus Woesearchaeota archaeon]
MEEKGLFALALACSLAGIIVLFFVSEKIEVKEESISSVLEKDVGSYVGVRGVVISQKESKGVALLKINDSTGVIDIVVFQNYQKIRNGEEITVTGKLEEFKSKKEIKAETIRLALKKSVRFIFKPIKK